MDVAAHIQVRCTYHALAELGTSQGHLMNSIIYLVGLVVVVLAILSLIGLR
ncbi:hypothetical protein EIO_1271 [Ketogulonicigenium vulgare Y25]|nr:hypothetical protein EIO_1271 [Ketogulonicigenium vulgare Y25]AOZ54325.1 hypothetical protein KVC_1308 [Ketogulonicigenium vulgare]